MAVINNDYCGIICINKPSGYTSFDVIAKLRGILKMKRLGHAGTLDPMATGVLPVFAGTATKACDMLPDHDKVYRAGFKLGVSTDTQDSTGIVLSENSITVEAQRLFDTAAGFQGDIMQLPPMYSAVSVGGKRLYELARQGKTIERTPRQISIYSLEIIEYDPLKRSGIMEISCSRGTYIRTLISDIGDSLGCGGIMTSLERITACGFTLDDCFSIEQLQTIYDNGGDFKELFLPISAVFDYLPKITLNEAQERMYRNGIRLDIQRISAENITASKHAVYGSSGNFLGTAVIMRDEKLLKIDKNFF